MSFVSWLNDVLYDCLPYSLAVMSFLITFGYLNFPDLTGAGGFVLGSAIAAIAVVRCGLNPYLALVLAATAGAAAGGVTAFLSIVLRIERLLAGILCAFFFYAVNQLLLTPTLPYGTHPTILSWAELRDRRIDLAGLAWHPYAIIVFGALVVGVKLILDWYFHSEVGLALRALEDVDAGEEVLRRNGLSPDAYRCTGLMAANCLVGLAGAVVSMRNSAANAHTGFDAVVTSLVAYMIGFQVLQYLSKVRNGKGIALAWIRRVHPTSAVILGTIIFFGLIDLSLRLNVKSELARMVLVIFVAVLVGEKTAITEILRPQRHAKPPYSNRTGGAVLSLRNISFRYPSSDVVCVQNVRLEIAHRERVALEGSNGSGKSTILKIASGLLAPLSGEIRLRGQDVTNDNKARLASVVYVDQNPDRGVVDPLTVEENLVLARTGPCASLWRRAVDRKKSTGLDRILELGGFPSTHLHRRASSLSGGQRQIANLLTLLARRSLPEVVLLDEPTNNLDADHTARCLDIIKLLRDKDVAVLFVSHSKLDGLDEDRVVRLPQE